jgi:hypothetical protein
MTPFTVLATLALAAVSTATLHTRRNVTASNHSRPKVILDNDWSSAGFIPFLMALSAGWDVLGLTSDTSDTWALQAGLHALATLEVGNLSCVPVYIGSDYPLLNTPKLFQAWETVHGVLPWEGAFARENLTAEAEVGQSTSSIKSSCIDRHRRATIRHLEIPIKSSKLLLSKVFRTLPRKQICVLLSLWSRWFASIPAKCLSTLLVL